MKYRLSKMPSPSVNLIILAVILLLEYAIIIIVCTVLCTTALKPGAANNYNTPSPCPYDHTWSLDFKYTAICGGDGLKELCDEVSAHIYMKIDSQTEL